MAPALVGVIGRLLVSRLVRLGFRTVEQVSVAEPAVLSRRAARAGFEVLLVAVVSAEPSTLHLRGELHQLAGTLWRDLVGPSETIVAHPHASVPFDAELRSFREPSRQAGWRFALTSFECPVCPVLALAALDIDRDGSDELVVLGEHTLAALSFQGRAQGFRLSQRLALPGPLASVGSRRPVGTLVRLAWRDDESPALLMRSSGTGEMARATVARGQLRLERGGTHFPLAVLPAPGAEPARLSADLEIGTDHFDAASLRLSERELVPQRLASLPASFYRLVATAWAPGSDEGYVGLVDLEGRLFLFDATLDQLVASLETVGVAFDLGDIDQDGALDLISTSGGQPDGNDGLSVYRLAGKGAPNPSLRLIWQTRDVGARVLALTHGDFDGDGRSEVLGALQREGTGCSLLRLE